MHRAFALLLLTLMVVGSGCREKMYPRVELKDGNPTPGYAALLTKVVTYDGYVNYDLLAENREPLDDFVAWMAYSRPWRLERPVDRPADFINAYNALVLYQVLERDRPASVMDVQGILGIPGGKFFNGTQFKLGREWITLSEIEHERVRNAILDHRVHAALNCASASCPPLRRELYSRRGLGVQLREQMGRWLDDDRGIQFDEDGGLLFNPIMDWFGRDFRFWSAGDNLCEISVRYTTGQRQRKVRAAMEDGCPHGFFEYDWSLNDTSTLHQ